MGELISLAERRPGRDDQYIDDVFGDDGLLARATRGYESRPGQIELARAVHTIFRDGGTAMLEGPCGTGKGRAYLVPAIEHALNTGKKAVIATASIALQEQLVHKDLPELQRVLGRPFRFALLKGRGNFVCNERSPSVRSLNPAERAEFDQLAKWSRTTQSGDRAELGFVPLERVWNRFALVDADDCKGTDCQQKEKCFHKRAGAGANDAHVIVVNYRLLFAHISVLMDGAEQGILPDFSFLVCDEGHEMADIAREFFGMTLRRGLFARAERFYRAEGEHLAARLDAGSSTLAMKQASARAKAAEDFGATFVGHLNRFVREQLDDQARERGRAKPDGNVHLDEPPPLPIAELVALARDVADRSATMLEQLDSVGGLTRPEKERRAIARTTSRKFKKLLGWATALQTLTDPNVVAWAHADDQGPSIEMRQIHVGKLIAEQLFRTTHAAAVTSATLTVAGSFAFIEREIGARPSVRLEVQSPFDFASRVMTVVPTRERMPAPSEHTWSEECALQIGRLVHIADGRTLALFSSRTQRDATYQRLTRGYNASDRQWLLQGDQSARVLCDAKRTDPRSVLLGTKSYWTGVDIPGEALCIVVIDRVPFPQPDDPIVRAIHKRNPRAFREHDLPRAIIALRQGFGRLMRSSSDYGAVVILDTRIATSTWGAQVWSSLPQTKRGYAIEDVRAHLLEFSNNTSRPSQTEIPF